MSSFRRRAALGLSVLALAVTVGWPAGHPEPARATPVAPTEDGPPTGPPGVLPPDRQWTVTLLTGEVAGIATDAEGRATVKVREASGPVDLLRRADGDVYVLPAAALPLVAGVVDRELFNVTGLVRQGYHDDATSTIPLIVQHLPAPAGAALDRAAGAGVAAADAAPPGPEDPAVDAPAAADVAQDVAPAPAEDPAGLTRPLPSIDAVAVAPPKGGPETAELLAALAAEAAAGDGARRGPAPRVWLDRRVGVTRADPAAGPAAPAVPVQPAPGPALDWNLAGIGADRAWAQGLRGEGVRVAVLDTGIDATHPDLVGQVVEQQNFGASPDTVDRYGHGTHVAATVAGTGAGAPGARSGVAPAADLVVGKVLDDDGFGQESDIIAGMEWAAARADVVNMSLGGPAFGDDPMAQALDVLTDQHGTLFVVSAGNSGPQSGTVGSPGVAERALTVGAADRDDELADFSSRGPLPGTYASKPDLVAPGVDVVAARAAGTTMGSPTDARYTRASGTSMAAPHVAGSAALLAGQHPDWGPDQLTHALVGSVDPVTAGGYDAGTGRLDVGSAAVSELQSGAGIVDLDLPHPRTAPHRQTLTWTNTGTTPLTVDLRAELEDRGGDPVADAATVEPAQVTVAPGATAEATLVLDAPALPDGLLSGAVVAESPGEQPVRTGLGVHAEGPMVDLTLEATPPEPDRPEQSPAAVFYMVTNLDDSALFDAFDWAPDLRPTLRVPAGRYAVLGVVHSGDGDNPVAALVGDPDVRVDGDTVVALDGEAAQTLAPDLAGADTATPTYSEAAAYVTPATGTGGEALSLATEAYHPDEPVRLGRLEGDADVFQGRLLFRLQDEPYTARLGGDPEPIIATPASTWTPPAGTTRLTAVDAGDGSDLTGTAGKLAVVQMPAESWMDGSLRAAVTHRAAEAGTVMVAFVDATRDRLDPSISPFQPWADIPVIAAGGDAATRLQAAAAAGRRVTFQARAASVVHDLTLGGDDIDATPVVDQAARDRLARIDERFHHDPDGTGPTYDSRGLMGYDGGYLATAGPLPPRRTSYLTPDVEWGSAAGGPFLSDEFGEELEITGRLSLDDGARYEPGSEQTVRWLRRPQWPGPVAVGMDDPFCPAYPSLRTATEVLVHVVPFRDEPDRFSCADVLGEELVLRRDGQELGREAFNSARFAVPAGAEDAPFELSYTQRGRAPYEHRSATTWTFRAPSPGDPAGGGVLLPLLTVRYQLPLDIENRPTDDTATLVVDHLDPEAPRRVESLLVWTSTDQGATWQPAAVTRQSAAKFGVALPDAPAGTAVSLRVDATDPDGSRIEQTLIDAYQA